jgi:hypothetical protein
VQLNISRQVGGQKVRKTHAFIEKFFLTFGLVDFSTLGTRVRRNGCLTGVTAAGYPIKKIIAGNLAGGGYLLNIESSNCH